MRQMKFSLGVAVALAAAGVSAADVLTPAALNDVRVGGRVGALQAIFCNERVFSDFAKKDVWGEAHEAFVHPDDDIFFKHIGMWKGEFWGKLMLSATRVAQYADNADLKDFLHREALALTALQRPDGYLGTYTNPEFIVPAPVEEQLKWMSRPSPWNWNLWCRKYTMWGLLACYRLTGDKALLTAADRMMENQLALLKRRGLRLCDTGTTSMRGFPPCSILKPLLWLYQETGKTAYLDYATEIWGYYRDGVGRAPSFTRLLASGRPLGEWYPREIGQWAKAYEMMSCMAGFVEYWRVTGDVAALDLTRRLQQVIRTQEFNLCCSVGYNDQFVGAARHLNGTSEPCDAVHWMRINHELYLATGEATYADAIEETLYNAFLAAVRPDGKWGARCVRSHGRHQLAPPQSGMKLQHCCVNNMPRGFMDVAQTILSKDATGALNVALYHDAAAKIGGDAVELTGDYPVGDTVTVKITRGSAGVVRFRMPAWCENLTVTGPEMRTASLPGWIVCAAPAGTSVWQLKFDMPPRLVETARTETAPFPNDYRTRRWSNPDEKDLISVFKSEPFAQVFRGPLMLAKCRKVGNAPTEIFTKTSVNAAGWTMTSEPIAVQGVWGAWKLTFTRKGESFSVKACDYPSAGEWTNDQLEFSTLF